jgi:malonate-semialdehyde dehydrogenase (acetylating)/methylmalonate-semialdehyde dehydrogenase
VALLSEIKSNYGRLRLYIDGKWIDSDSTEVYPITNPAKGEVIAEAPYATGAEIAMAVDAAQRGFEKWRNVPLRDRARLMWDLRDKFEKHFEELTRVLTQNHGRTIEESRGSLRRVIENVESACSTMYTLAKGEQVNELSRGIDQTLVWEPLGVFLIITPSNIPMHAWSSFVPYALACGCSVIVSPSRHCAVASDWISKVAEEIGLPPGAYNLVHGGRHNNKALLSHSKVKGVGFIGSTNVGKELYRLCGELGKRASINGSGKNYIVIMPDADWDTATGYLLRGCFGMAGQRCLGTDNIVAVGDVYEEIKSRFVEAAAKMKLGYGLDEETELGPLTTEQGRQKVIDWIDTGLKEGAKIILDRKNEKVKGYPNGYFLGPTIFENVNPDMTIAKEEAFGPVANLMRASNLDEAIEWINTKTNLGHSACILTASGKNARKFACEVEVGNVGINVGIPQPFAFFPLGSKKESSLGVAKSRMDSVRLFTDQKTITSRWT